MGEVPSPTVRERFQPGPSGTEYRDTAGWVGRSQRAAVGKYNGARGQTARHQRW